ncbi:MAG TPA: hypothetical protein VHF26_06025, partial [Trebonia sp.]|nr:hypothetical protein [Trebonia sp.]
MSFLSRKPARPGARGGEPGRDEFDDFDGYAPDGYANDEDNWSPGEYFSPEGIRGRRAGGGPEGRSGNRGRRDGGRDADDFSDGLDGSEYGGYTDDAKAGGYGADEYASGAYDLPEGTDADRPERGRRKRSRDREDRGERTGILWLRRDRGEDIWPDDGISDEDYWASVAADRPLSGADDAPEAHGSGPRPGAGSRGGGEPGLNGGAGTGGDARFGGESRFGGDARGGDQRGINQRGVTGRLGPPPGLDGDDQPGGAPSGTGAMNGTGAMGAGGLAGGRTGRTGS